MNDDKAPVIIGEERKPGWRRFATRRSALVLLVVFCMVTAGTAAYQLLKPKPSTEELQYATELSPVEKSFDEAVELASSNLEEAKRKAQETVDIAKTAQEKARYLKGKAHLCAEYKDWRCALEGYQQADSHVAEDYFSARAKGHYYEQLGETGQAIAAYRRALALQEGVVVPAELPNLEDEIERLEQQ